MKLIVFFAIAAMAGSVAFANVDFKNSEGFSNGRTGLPPSAETAWDATVKIEKLNLNCSFQGLTRSWGAGVVVKYEAPSQTVIVVTNSHVIHGCHGQSGRLQIGFNQGEESKAVSDKTQVLVDLPKNDLAILRVRVPRGARPNVAKLALPTETSEVLAIGFPDLTARQDWNVKPQNRSANIQRYSIGFVRRIQINRPLYAPKNDQEQISYTPVIYSTVDILPGNSGGPLLNQEGEVIGLNTMMIRHLTPDEKDKQGLNNYFYCANLAPSPVSDCENLAISSEIILRELEKLH